MEKSKFERCKHRVDSAGTVARNQVNLYNKLFSLVLGRYGVRHAEVNRTESGEEGRMETGMGTETERAVQSGQNETRNRVR